MNKLCLSVSLKMSPNECLYYAHCCGSMELLIRQISSLSWPSSNFLYKCSPSLPDTGNCYQRERQWISDFKGRN